jgi:hypothetical protein
MKERDGRGLYCREAAIDRRTSEVGRKVFGDRASEWARGGRTAAAQEQCSDTDSQDLVSSDHAVMELTESRVLMVIWLVWEIIISHSPVRRLRRRTAVGQQATAKGGERLSRRLISCEC